MSSQLRQRINLAVRDLKKVFQQQAGVRKVSTQQQRYQSGGGGLIVYVTLWLDEECEYTRERHQEWQSIADKALDLAYSFNGISTHIQCRDLEGDLIRPIMPNT